MKSLSYLHWIKNVFSSKLNAKCVRCNIKLVKKFQITSLVLKAKLKLFASITYLSFLYRSEVMERERWNALHSGECCLDSWPISFVPCLLWVKSLSMRGNAVWLVRDIDQGTVCYHVSDVFRGFSICHLKLFKYW